MDEMDKKKLNWISNRVFNHNSNKYGILITNKSTIKNDNLKNWYKVTIPQTIVFFK